MDEHDDDLESTVDVGASEEDDDFPKTAEDLEQSDLDPDAGDDDVDLDEDKSEL